MSKYSELLKDPRWQKKRLEILSRDGWKCVRCEGEKETLHAHHKYYIYGKDPWDYQDCVFVTLCDTCHKHEHKYIKSNSKSLLIGMCEGGFLSDEINLLSYSFKNIKHIYNPYATATMLSWAVRDVKTMEYINNQFLNKIGRDLAGDIDDI